MGKKRKPIHPNDPLLYPDHPRPVSRRDFIRQGLMTGSGVAMSSGILSLFTNPREVHALTEDIKDIATASGCPVQSSANPNVPVICFDLAGGANLAGSNVMVGGAGGQMDFISDDGYSRLGIPASMSPNNSVYTAANPLNTELGLAFHPDSALLNGILQKFTDAAARARVDGVLIPARSDNDTGNNPHNPMYGFAHAFGIGDITTLVGSRNSDSGGNSIAPIALNRPDYRPVKIDRPSDVSGLVDTSNLTAVLDTSDVNAVMESIARISHQKMNRSNPQTVTRDEVIQHLVKCGYIDAAALTENFAGQNLDPGADTFIFGQANSIFSDDDWNVSRDRGEFRKTASVMKMVVEGHAAAGTVTMGGFDYHTGDRAVGELRDERAGKCIGACLQYAALKGQSLMIYCFSDGSVSSNGRIDDSPNGGGKGEWTSDNSSTAASFVLVYHPTDKPQLIGNYAATRQMGYFSGNGSVVTSATAVSNNVNLLVNSVVLNYMALNGNVGAFENLYSSTIGVSHGLGDFSNYIAFNTLPPVPVA